jgi:acyl-CoA thioesterase I
MHTGREVQVTNPAVNGYTTADLIEHELPALDAVDPQLVSVLIGVNDLVRGRSLGEYRESLARIYEAVASRRLPSGRVAGISIPNWSVVPAARDYGEPARVRGLTDAFNDAARSACAASGFTWVDITAVSTSGLGSAGWIASDDLHPGDLQYRAWAELIWHVVQAAWTTV